MASNDSESGESEIDVEELCEDEATNPPAERCASSDPGSYWRAGHRSNKLVAATPPPSSQKSKGKGTANYSPRGKISAFADLEISGEELEEGGTQNHTNPGISQQGHPRRGSRQNPNMKVNASGRPGTQQLDRRGSNEAVELPPVLPLNVGGYRFMTRQSTLCKYGDSMLATMFSGRHKLDKDKQGYFFIDSNGAYFGYILEYLRHETLPPTDVAVNVYKEARYYNIAPLMERLQTSPSVAKTIVHEAHRAQFPDYYGLKQKVVRTAMDNAVVNQTGEVLVYAFQKVFTPRAPYFNPQHECVVDGAHICVGPWDSPADEEVLIRCIEYDLLAEGFNVKPHEQRRRCKYYNGQNCQKSIYRITIFFA